MTIPAAASAAPPVQGFAASLLVPRPIEGHHEARRFATGLGMTAIYGLVLGIPSGIPSMFAHAVGVPLGFAAVALVGGPAFYIALAHSGADVNPRELSVALVHGVACGGLLLAGLSPLTLLLAASCESDWAVAFYAVVGLSVAAALGLNTTFRELARLRARTHGRGRWPRAAFALFALLLYSRVWIGALPLFGGR